MFGLGRRLPGPALALATLLVLAGCSTLSAPQRRIDGGVVAQVAAPERQAELVRQQWLRAHPDWTFQGRVAIAKGRSGGSGRVDWRQHGEHYQVQLSAPVTRQSWLLDGDVVTGAGRLDGVAGGTRAGDDAERVLLEATGWQVPVNQLPAWVRGQYDQDAAAIGFAADGRPRRLQAQGWVVDFLDWYPPQADGRPALPRRIEARNGDATVRLVLDHWEVVPR